MRARVLYVRACASLLRLIFKCLIMINTGLVNMRCNDSKFAASNARLYQAKGDHSASYQASS
jgi:hypothetical protein